MRKLTILFVGLFAAGALNAQPANLTQTQAEAKLTAAGYDDVRDLELDDGFWEADARKGDGAWVDVRVHPVSGKVYAEDTTPKLDAASINTKLTAAGYSNVRDIDFDDGVWSVDARNKAGDDVDLAIDPDDGTVLFERLDD